MKRKVIIMTGLLLAVTALTVYCFAENSEMKIKSGTIRLKQYSEADYPYLAKILPGQAVEKALGKVGGKLLKLALENENDFLVYSIELVTPCQLSRKLTRFFHEN
ncbi:PepSY domain-containing protein [Desulfovulcanus sp.]